MEPSNRPVFTVVILFFSLLFILASLSPVLAATVFRFRPSTTQTFYLQSGSRFLYQSSGTNTVRFVIRPTPTLLPPEPEPPTAPDPAPIVGNLTAREEQLVNLINTERLSRGLNPVQVDMQVVEVARLKSQDMITHQYFSHQSPTYGSPFQMLRTFGVSFVAAGENIAGNPSVTGAHTAFMNSIGHRNNILNVRWTHVGIGVIPGGPYGMMHTQIFLRR